MSFMINLFEDNIIREMNKFLNNSNISLLLSSVALLLISINELNSVYYCLFLFLYSSIILTINYLNPIKNLNFSTPIVLVSLVVILLSMPIYENDHYRYFWEGNILLKGQNPYLNSPRYLINQGITYELMEKIGFPSLTSPYPPLSLLIFSIGSILGMFWATKLFMVINFLFMVYCFHLIQSKIKPLHVLLILPFFLKEYVQAIHIDFISFTFFFLFLLNQKTKKKTINFLYLIISIGTKIIGAVGLIYYLKEKKYKEFLLGILATIFLLSPFYFYYTDNSGIMNFSKYWVWNPGMYSFFHDLLKIEYNHARSLTFIMFIVLSTILSIKLLLQKSNSKNYLIFFYLIFSSLMFFTPVFNSWYCIWFLGPALLLNLTTPIFYALFSSLSYLYYVNQEWMIFAQVISHTFYLLSLGEIFLKYVKKTQPI